MGFPVPILVIICPVVLLYLAFKWMIFLALIDINFGLILLTIHLIPFLALLLFS